MEGLESFFTASEQLKLFLLSCLFGIPLGIIYDIFRVIRLLIPHNKLLVAIEDILYFCIYGIFLMCFVSAMARSEFRFYFCMGNLLGFILYYFTMGNAVVGILRKIIGFIKKLFEAIFKPLHRKIALISKKIRPFFVGSFKNIKLGKKNQKIHLIDEVDMLYNKKTKRKKQKKERVKLEQKQNVKSKA